jgi:hypothetical protein
MNRNTLIEINVQLTDAQAREFAQFLKRVCFSDYRGYATSDAEARHMLDAGEKKNPQRPCRARLCTPVARVTSITSSRRSRREPNASLPPPWAPIDINA